jgi:hypothetical protein
MAAMILLNNGRPLYEIEEANKKLTELVGNFTNFDNISYVINQEIYYILKYKRAKDDITKDKILSMFIGKFAKGIYIKTPEVKKIISHINYDTHKEANLWFFKNVECGYVPTPAVLELVFNIMTPESKMKLYEIFPSKVDTKHIFNSEFLIKTIFTTSDVNKIEEEFSTVVDIILFESCDTTLISS